MELILCLVSYLTLVSWYYPISNVSKMLGSFSPSIFKEGIRKKYFKLCGPNLVNMAKNKTARVKQINSWKLHESMS
jgi:hypothetical protein